MPKPITPLLAADTLIELLDQPGRPFVLIERANPPYGWALPGGFVDVGESVEQAAVREAKEETGLDAELSALLGIYSNPNRDPRGHTVTAVYIAQAHGTPVAADDAKHCSIFTFDDLPQQLAFDHAQVIADYQRFRTTGQVAPLR
ncbi:NUDIX domain-containing protein [Methylomarinum vadi]|uniref:NUDIX domain-containing protein n=1 Tax=Methylomarinum vadi TaxID=438855 RepID=UPI0004DFB439|nr:NUDIX hydrolase [Methylomarinum vadi]